ncbi:TetR/AcrR family transcriptional regulator [Sphingomonas sp. ID0503]|uniref:TetR/AcrR family transcriptional regulator n=1 Tax=Sphingomonas sp. ID0503 TaxID=3399691 RepID=UPI003AFB7F8D
MNAPATIPAKGRPREFDTDVALAAALRVFWKHGYDGASMADLTEAMGITKPSLYAAFGNKEALFNKALDLYEREKLAYMTSALSAPTLRGVAERLLTGALALQTNDCDPKGCMAMSAITCGPEAESIRAAVIERRSSSSAALVARFEQAKAEGELPQGIEPMGLARHLLSNIQGMNAQAAAGASAAELKSLVDTALALWPTK